MIETGVIETWLYGLLTGDTTLNAQNGGRVYGYLAPMGAALPLTVFQPQSLSDVPAIGSHAFARNLYTVKMVGKTDDMAALQAGSDRIDALLEGTIVASGGLQLRMRRQMAVSYVETQDNTRFAHLGAVYRIYAS